MSFAEVGIQRQGRLERLQGGSLVLEVVGLGDETPQIEKDMGDPGVGFGELGIDLDRAPLVREALRVVHP